MYSPPRSPNQPLSPVATSTRYISPLDVFMRTLNPDHPITPEEEIIKMLLQGGKSRKDLDKIWEGYKNRCDEMVRQLETRPRVAEKPKAGDPTVQYYDVPESPFGIRIWDGAMHQYGQFCLDLYDVQNSVALNMPSEYSLVHVPHPGVYTFGGRGGKLVSWEESWGIARKEVKPGLERFTVPEGARLMLVRPNHNPFYFQIPTRAGVVGQYAQPQAHLPVSRV